MSQALPIEIRNVKMANLKGGILIDGFPSGGLSNSIASMCFMSSIQSELISVLESPIFPSVSTVLHGVANSPARIYANAELGISFLISELNLNESLYFPVSKAIIRWAKEHECKLVINSGTIVSPNTKGLKQIRKGHKPQNIYGAASTESAMQTMINCEIPELELYSGPVTGIPGLLLNEGATINFDVIVRIRESANPNIRTRSSCSNFASNHEASSWVNMRY